MKILFCFCLCVITLIKSGATEHVLTLQEKLESMEKKIEEMNEKIEVLEMEKESRHQQCEDKMLETNSEMLKMINDVRKLNEENSKCNLFLTTCMTQKSQEKCDKPNENQLTVSAMDKLLKEFQVRNWMTNQKLEDTFDLNEALLKSWNSPITGVLISLGANVNIQDENGNTPLITYVEYRKPEVVKVLIQKGANVNLQNKDGWTALMKAANLYPGHSDLAIKEIISNLKNLEILLKNNADVNLMNKNNETALMIAAKNGHTEIVKILLNHEAIVEVQDKDGNTALILACQNGKTGTAIALLDLKQNVNIKNYSGQTALMLVRDLQLAKKLVDSGADIYIKDNNGRIFLDMLDSWSNQQMYYYINSLTTTTPKPITYKLNQY